MCKYCEPSEYDDRFWIYEGGFYDAKILSDGDMTLLLMVHDKKTKKFSLCASGEDEALKIIKYCPMCGRKL